MGGGDGGTKTFYPKTTKELKQPVCNVKCMEVIKRWTAGALIPAISVTAKGAGRRYLFILCTHTHTKWKCWRPRGSRGVDRVN